MTIDLEEIARKEAALRRQIRWVNIVLLFVLAALVIGPLAVGYWVTKQYPYVSTIGMKNMTVLGESALCPGDLLTVAFDFHTEGSGVLVRDDTTRLLEPPKTIIFSDWHRFILEGPMDERIVDGWHVPATYLNPETDRIEPIPVGDYRRTLSISSPSRSTIVAIGGVDFSIKEDCPHE